MKLFFSLLFISLLGIAGFTRFEATILHFLATTDPKLFVFGTIIVLVLHCERLKSKPKKKKEES